MKSRLLGDCDLTCHTLHTRSDSVFCFVSAFLYLIWELKTVVNFVFTCYHRLLRRIQRISAHQGHIYRIYSSQREEQLIWCSQEVFPKTPYNFLFHLTLWPLIFPSLCQCLQGEIAAECGPTWTKGELSFTVHFRICLLSREISLDYLSLQVFFRNN